MPGDTAVFVASKNHITQKDNYIALTFDKRLYYIEAESVKSFKLNLASESVAFGKRLATSNCVLIDQLVVSIYCA